MLPEWEDGHFYLAKYYDKLMPMVTDNKMEKQGDLIRYIVHHFGRLDYRKMTIISKKCFWEYILAAAQTDS